MVIHERNRLIKEIREKVPGITLEQIGQMFPREDDKKPLSRQRVHQIITQCEKYDIMSPMENINKLNIGNEPISATQAARKANIPYYIIADWVRRGLVQIVYHPGHATCGKPVLLDPVSLQERIDRYRPRSKKKITTA